MTTTIKPLASTQKPALAKPHSEIQLKPVSREEFTLLESEWDTFHAQTQIPSPFQSWDYLSVWWQVYGDKGYDGKMFIARDDNGQIIGAAPLMITQKGAFAGSRGKFRHLAFMGGAGELLGESLEIPALPGYEEFIGEAVADLILDTYNGQWDVAYFYLVPETSVSTHAMLKKLAEHGIATKATSSLASPCITIDGTWEEHMESRSTKFASRVRYIQSYATRRFDMKVHAVENASEFDCVINHMVRLSMARWGDEAQAFHTDAFTEFHRLFAPQFFSKGGVSCGTIELKGEIAGTAYNFVYDNKMWGYQAPWDMKYKAARAGNLLHIWSAKNACDLGLRELDTLPGDAGYKDEWTDNEHTLNIYECAHPGTVGGTLFKVARKIDRMLKHKPNPVTSS
mgnify:CR=1 FL=1